MAQFTVLLTSKDFVPLYTQIEAASEAQAEFAQRDLQRFTETQDAKDLWASGDFTSTRWYAEISTEVEALHFTLDNVVAA